MYEMLAQQYSALFPPDTARCSFVIDELGNKNPGSKPRILDAGCANGDLAFELAAEGCDVTGVDLDESMINEANRRLSAENTAGLRFGCRSLTDITDLGDFEAIVCFGNTLPHLPDIETVGNFFRAAAGVLEPGGGLIFQIINFDRLGDRKYFDFPDIDSERSLFRRSYSRRPDGRLDFNISLTDKRSGETVSDSTPLLPLLRDELTGMLGDAGFGSLKIYSGYDRAPADCNEFASIYSVRHPYSR